jgi:MtN3 and saliva related transmembrane protein
MSSSKRLSFLFLICTVMILAGCSELGIQDTESLFFPGFRRSEVVGFIAGLGTTFAALPDLIAMIKRRSSKGMNPRMAAIMGAFQIVWVYYGLLIGSRPVVLWNIIAVGTNFFSVGAYHYFARREREQA